MCGLCGGMYSGGCRWFLRVSCAPQSVRGLRPPGEILKSFWGKWGIWCPGLKRSDRGRKFEFRPPRSCRSQKGYMLRVVSFGTGTKRPAPDSWVWEGDVGKCAGRRFRVRECGAKVRCTGRRQRKTHGNRDGNRGQEARTNLGSESSSQSTAQTPAASGAGVPG